MPSTTVVALLNYGIQFATVGLIAALLRSYHRSTGHQYLHWWFLSWCGFAAYLIAATLALFWSASVGPARPLRLSVTLASQLGSYFQLAWLMLGTLALAGRTVSDRARNALYATAVGAAVIATVAYVGDPSAGMERLFVRVGVRSLAAAVVFCAAAWIAARVRHPKRGPRLLALALGLYGVQQLHYAVLATLTAFVTRSFFTYSVYMGVLDALLQFCVGLGMMVWVLEEQQIRAARAEARRRMIVDSALEAVITMDERGRITDWNPQAEKLFGWSREEALGARLDETVIPERFRTAHREGLARFLETGEGKVLNRRLQLNAVNRGGQEFPVELTITPMASENGWEFSGFLRDLTRQRAMEGQLRQASKMQAVGRLAGGIAHDFNNLLTVITGHVQLLQSQPRVEGDDPALDSINGAAFRGAELVKQLLAFSRQGVLDVDAIDLGETCRDSLSMLRRLLPENIEIATAIEPDLPPIAANEGALQQIILNLATNARDAMRSGGELTLEVKPGVDRSGTPMVYFAVRDTGTGVALETAERVFDPFFTTKEPGQGTGLGLSVVYGLVEQFDGTIEFDSRPGVGTRVQIGFPARRPA